MITQGRTTVAEFVATTSSVVAEPCRRRAGDFYESNVCWLMESEANFDDVTPKVMLFLVQAQAYEVARPSRGGSTNADGFRRSTST